VSAGQFGHHGWLRVAASDRFSVGSGQHEAFALRFGDGIPELSRGVDPQFAEE
jgi:hypothetical protein